MTGRTNIDNIKEETIKNFVNKGLNADKTKRYQNIGEMINAIKSL